MGLGVRVGMRGRADHAHEPVAQNAAEEGRLEGHARLGDSGAHGGAAQRAERAWSGVCVRLRIRVSRAERVLCGVCSSRE